MDLSLRKANGRFIDLFTSVLVDPDTLAITTSRPSSNLLTFTITGINDPYSVSLAIGQAALVNRAISNYNPLIMQLATTAFGLPAINPLTDDPQNGKPIGDVDGLLDDAVFLLVDGVPVVDHTLRLMATVD